MTDSSPVGPPIAQNLMAEFVRTGYTVDHVAREMKISERQIRRWRNGDGNPSWTRVLDLASVFNRNPAWFYEDHSAEKEAA